MQSAGQCGCYTVLVDGAPRVSCVTPMRRVRDRIIITTFEGLPDDLSKAWAESFASTGGSQCGFCTPALSGSSDPILISSSGSVGTVAGG